MKVSLELQEAICRFRIPGELRQVFDAIMRKTYGWNKKQDVISNSQIVILTGLKKANVSRSLSKLITHKLVIKTDNSLSVNKDYEQWLSFSITAPKVIKTDSKVIKSDNKKLSKVMDTKDNKDNIQKTINNLALIPQLNEIPEGAYKIALLEFIDYRKEIKKPITRLGLKALLNKLDGLSDDEKIESLTQSMASGYQGVFKPKTKKGGTLDLSDLDY